MAYPLLCQTTSALVLGVAEEFDDTLLIGGETVKPMLARSDPKPFLHLSWPRFPLQLRYAQTVSSPKPGVLVSGIDVPSDLTGDLPHECGPLGQEALAAGDPGGRLPRGDLCSSSRLVVLLRNIQTVVAGGYVLWPALGPTMRPVVESAFSSFTIYRNACIRTGALLDFLRHGCG
jgi:hypothetical protein